MAISVHTFETFFSKESEHPKNDQSLVEYVSEHTHEDHPGYLFKHLISTQPLFIRKDQLLHETPEKNSQYHFVGFADASSVVMLEKRL